MDRVAELAKNALVAGETYAGLVERNPAAANLYVGVFPKENWTLDRLNPTPEVIGIYLTTTPNASLEDERLFYRLAAEVNGLLPNEIIRMQVLNPRWLPDHLSYVPRSTIMIHSRA